MTPQFDTTLLDSAHKLAEFYFGGAFRLLILNSHTKPFKPLTKKQLVPCCVLHSDKDGSVETDISSWRTAQILVFLEKLLDIQKEKQDAKEMEGKLRVIDQKYSFTSSKNSEIRFRWYTVRDIGNHITTLLALSYSSSLHHLSPQLCIRHFCHYFSAYLSFCTFAQRRRSYKEMYVSASSQICTLLGNGVFVWTTLCLSCLFFVVTGIQFWITPYLGEGFCPLLLFISLYRSKLNPRGASRQNLCRYNVP